MKTTLELPDDLIRQVKIRAVHEGRKLKDLIAELIRRGLRHPPKTGRVAKKRMLRISATRGGVRRGVNLNDSAALLERMES
jgi:hypothetical protein